MCSLPTEEIDNEPDGGWLAKHVGFVSDPNQINVGITRAMEGLCIIGEIPQLIFVFQLMIKGSKLLLYVAKIHRYIMFLFSQRRPRVAQLQSILEKSPEPLQASQCSDTSKQDFSALCHINDLHYPLLDT